MLQSQLRDKCRYEWRWQFWMKCFFESFGDCTKLLCKWHVKRTWGNKIPLCGSKQLQEEVYQPLEVILEETSIKTFEKMLVGSLRKYEDICPKFVNYFKKHLSKQTGKMGHVLQAMQIQILICSLNHSTINLKLFISNECQTNE